MSAEVGVARAAPHPGRVWSLGFFAIIGMQVMAVLDATIVVVALPNIRAAFGFSHIGQSWVVTAYVVTFGSLLLLGGRIGDAVGHKRAFIGGVTLFTVASLVCGLATDGLVMILARAAQGMGTAVGAPTGLALIASIYPAGRARTQAFAISAAVQGVGGLLGLVLGGVLTQVSWRWAFLINIPIGIAIIAISRSRLPETRKERLRLDAAGAVLATGGCIAVLVVLTQHAVLGWFSAPVMAAIAVAVLAFGAFAFVERAAENPLVPFGIFRDRNRAPVFVVVFLSGGLLLSLMVMIGLYAQDVLGYSPLQAGLAFIPIGIAVGVGNLAAARLAPQVAPRWLISGGATLVLVAMLSGTGFTRDSPYFPNMVVPLVVGGVGVGLMTVLLPLCAIADVEPAEIGPVSAVC